ncbi:MAG TPA: beta-glucosidase BglX [Beijerinckiaceae bacterium]|jgi:beta-glucosidase
MIRRLFLRLALLCLIGPLLVSPAPAQTAPDPVATRVEDLLRQMTLDEKVGQLTLVSWGPEFDADMVRAGRVGAVINFNFAKDVAQLQAINRETRLKIPLIFGLDILHGFRTIFPVPLAEAATFDPDLVRAAAERAAVEARMEGVQWTYAPMVDISRDPRWGRMVEGSGEDPLLGSVLARARTEGFRAGGIATGVKHFAGYGAAEGGRDYDKTDIPTALFRDVYLAPFRAAVEAGTETVMSAFNALNGVPAMANPWLLKDVLRGELGFKGFVISDWAGILELIAHGVARDEAEAVRKAILAGIDMDLAGKLYDRHLANEVRAGRVPESVVDDAVRRVLTVKVRMGLFEMPPPDPNRPEDRFVTSESRALARRLARDSYVLLQNRGNAIPLAAGAKRIALVGGLAEARNDQLGAHTARGWLGDAVTYREGLERRAAQTGQTVTYAEGCDGYCESAAKFPEAVAAAKDADVVVAVLGEPLDMTGEASSRAFLTLPNKQEELLDALVATGKPVILVLVASRPLEITRVIEKVQAILVTWFPGIEGGPALADILFGDEVPSGRLPTTWMRSVGQLPLYYNRLPTGRPTRDDNRFTTKYVDESIKPLFPFGYGLTTTRFDYDALRVDTPVVTPGETIRVSVKLSNTGARTGRELVQLYTRQPAASRSRPMRELKAFAKVELKAGETRRVALEVPAKDLGFHLEDGTYVVEPGVFQIFVGGDAETDFMSTVEVAEGLRLPPGARANP